MKNHLLIIPVIFLFAAQAFAAPSVNGISGTVEHGQNVTISGSGFGVKIPTAPLLWDTIDNQPRYAGLVNGNVIPTGAGYPWGENYDGQWGGSPMAYSTQMHRDPHTASYYGDGKSFLNNATAIENLSNTLYVSWYFRPDRRPWCNDIMCSVKFLRSWDDPSGNGTRLSWSQTQMTAYPNSPTTWGNWTGAINEWNRHEIWIDATNHIIRTQVNGILNHNVTDFYKVDNSYTLGVSLLGLDPNQGDLVENINFWMADIYVDTTQARVEICDASTWSACTNREIQIPSAWTDNSIVITSNQGDFSTLLGKYLYVIDANGEVNTNGYLLSSGPSDTIPPTVSLTAPANGSTVSGASVSVSANASDNVGVAGVQFRLDGANLGNEDVTSPYSIIWNTTSASNGSHSLIAIARDAAWNQTTSSSITVTVNNIDTTPPSAPTGLEVQ